MLNANSAVPLYQQVAEDIKNRITSGEYSPGQALPSESRLCEQYSKQDYHPAMQLPTWWSRIFSHTPRQGDIRADT